MIKSSSIHPDLLDALNLLYKPNGLIFTNHIPEKQSQEYGACEFKLNKQFIKFRVAKITPTKIGQFVTFWKRIEPGIIAPFDIDDQFDFLIVSTRKNKNFGQFIIPKAALYKHGILSKNEIGGKRAFRIYPSWDTPDSQQAIKTQQWQLNYFFRVKQNKIIDTELIQKLFT